MLPKLRKFVRSCNWSLKLQAKYHVSLLTSVTFNPAAFASAA